MKKLVIIPAFNESASIERAVDDIRQNAPGFDYIVINDCSIDDTLEVCRKNGIKHVNLSVNLGIGLLSGRHEIRLLQGLRICDPV